MAEKLLMRHKDRQPTHPGALLREMELPAMGISKSQAARMLGISRQTLHGILSEKMSVTAEMAVRLGKLCGNGPRLWINMQTAYDLWQAERTVDTADIPTVTKAA